MGGTEIVSIVKHGWIRMYRFWKDYNVYEELGAIRNYSRV